MFAALFSVYCSGVLSKGVGVLSNRVFSGRAFVRMGFLSDGVIVQGVYVVESLSAHNTRTLSDNGASTSS